MEKGERPTHALPFDRPEDESQAQARADALARIVAQLRQANALDLAPKFIERALGDERELSNVIELVGRLAAKAERGEEIRASGSVGPTLREVALMWTSGELARKFPDHVRAKRSVKDDVQRLDAHILPLVRDVPIAAFAIEHAERVMAALPSTLAPATRRQVAQVLSRVLSLSVYPLRLRESNPLPRGWLPRNGQRKALAFLYPTEDAKLLACIEVPLAHRLFYGVAAREGMRKSELLSLTWSCVDRERGAMRLDENKTDDPRAWALDPGVTEALRLWHAMRDEPEDDERVFSELEDVGVRGSVRT